MKIEFSDGKSVEVSSPRAVGEIIREAVGDRASEAIAALVNGELRDLQEVLESDASVEPIFPDHPLALEILRHSAAHLMAGAVVELFPDVKVTIGPAIEDGFYYDFYYPKGFSDQDLERIEKLMRKMRDKDLQFERRVVSRADAEKLFRDRGEKFKLEILEEIEGDTVTLYRHGNFEDLCRGPHVPSTGRIPAFKLLHVSGAYWRGDENRESLQRIYGTAFFSEDELKEHLHRLEEAKKRDHRRLGRDLDLFSIQESVGPGLVLWHPKGAMVRHIMETFWRDEHLKNGYELVYTPHLARLGLWETSGHTSFYKDAMFPSMDMDNQAYQVKPMNCPFHIQIYKSRVRSYRELPLRWAELGTVYRYERSGVMHGLLRVRGFTQDDAHHFFTAEQAEEEITRTIDFSLRMLRAFGFNDFKVYLSTRPEKRVGDDSEWDAAESALKVGLEKSGVSFEEDPGEGVFYGPKIDIKLRDSLGRLWQCSTIQFDFNLPERFDLYYSAEDGTRKRPFMLHRALLGSLERFFGCLIEHYAGAFPLWLSPEQVRVIPVSSEQSEYAADVRGKILAEGLRCGIDLSNEKLGRKIRQAQLEKIPYMVICGRREVESGCISVRSRSGETSDGVDLAAWIEELKREASRRA